MSRVRITYDLHFCEHNGRPNRKALSRHDSLNAARATAESLVANMPAVKGLEWKRETLGFVIDGCDRTSQWFAVIAIATETRDDTV